MEDDQTVDTLFDLAASANKAHHLAPNLSGETIMGTKQSGVSSSWNMSTQDCMEIERTQQSKCIKCGEGG